jgi:hypothetical protein
MGALAPATFGYFSTVGKKCGSVNFEMSFWCFQIDQKTNKILVRISALASKKDQIKKIRALIA